MANAITLVKWNSTTSTLPANIQADDLLKFSSLHLSGTYRCQLRPLGKIYALERSYISGPSGEILPESINPRMANPISPRLRFRVLWRRLVAWPFSSRWKEAVWITDRTSKSTYHYLTEALPKLFLLNQIKPEMPVVLPGRFKSHKLAQATLSHFKNLDIQYLDKGRLGIIETSWYVDYVAPIERVKFAHNGKVLAEMAQFYRGKFGVPENQVGRRIYISRQGSGRKIENAEIIERLLLKAGFETVFLERMTFEDQVRKLSTASVIIGCHGAGLANMMFSPQGATIVEFTHPQYPDFFFQEATSLGHSYYYLNAKAATIDPLLPAIKSDLLVDPVSLEALLNELKLL